MRAQLPPETVREDVAPPGPDEALVVDGIPWNPPGREPLRADVRSALRRGDETRALLLLLGDNDDWWDEPPPPEADLRRALSAPTLREAARWLGMGRVGDYFAYRWSDPSYLAGLALLQATWPGPSGRVVELACGVGHYLRELALRGVQDLVGIDVVFSKLWLARRFVCPSARYLCQNATGRLPFGDATSAEGVDLALCSDAIYFLPQQEQVVAEMQRVGRTVAIGHAHLPGEAGHPRSPEGWAALLPGADVYDDDELTRAFVEGRPPRTGGPFAEAVDLVWRHPSAGAVAPSDAPDFGVALPGRPLRVNPLYDASGVLRWPNERYAEEYGPRSGYLPPTLADTDLVDPAQAYRRRLLLDLPERW